MEVTHTSDSSEYVTIGEAAIQLGVSRKTLRRWDQKGLLKARRTPTGHRRFLRADVKAAIAEQVQDDAEQAS